MEKLNPTKRPRDESNTRGIRYSTEDLPERDRQEWLREVIGREYANVEITPPTHGRLFSEMIIYPWKHLRLSTVRSHEITIVGLPHEPHMIRQYVYLAVVHLAGEYHLQQNAREVFLKPGDMALYDATLPHRIDCSRNFSKLIVSIPRGLLRDRIAGLEHCTALRIPGNSGIGSVTSRFIQSIVKQIHHLNAHQFCKLSEYALDFLTLALASVRPANCAVNGNRPITVNRIKNFVDQHLSDAALNTAMIERGVGMSARHINALFSDEGISLMRYVWRRRLENCRTDLLDPMHTGHRLTDIALRWGFKDSSHFSRRFKEEYGCSPREYREQNRTRPAEFICKA